MKDFRIDIIAEVLHGKEGWNRIKKVMSGNPPEPKWANRERKTLSRALEAIDEATAKSNDLNKRIGVVYLKAAGFETSKFEDPISYLEWLREQTKHLEQPEVDDQD